MNGHRSRGDLEAQMHFSPTRERAENTLGFSEVADKHCYRVPSESEVGSAEVKSPVSSMSEQFQKTLPYFPGLRHSPLLNSIQSSLLGAHSLPQDSGLNSSYPGYLQPLPESAETNRVQQIG